MTRWPGGRVHEDQMAVAGGSGGGIGQEFKQAGARSGDKRQLEARYEWQWPDGVGYCRQDCGGGALGWDTRQKMEWGSRHMVGLQTGVGFQSCSAIPDTDGVPDRDGGVPDISGGVPDRRWYTRGR